MARRGTAAGGLGELPRPPAVPLLRVLFFTLALVSLVCGYIGLAAYVRDVGGYSDNPLDLLYFDLQLFALSSPPLGAGGPYPLALNIARFGAPAVTVYALVEAGRLLFATELRRVRTRNARGHIVVCGDTLVAGTLTRRLRAAGERVVVVPSDAVASEPGPLRAGGGARDPDVLRAAGVGRARALYACTDDSAANTAIALAAARPRQGRPPLAVYAQVADPEVCAALQARLISTPASSGVRLDFFNVDDLAARKLIAQDPLAPPLPRDRTAPEASTKPPLVTVLGATAFGRAVLVELARAWRLRDPGGALLPVTVIDPEATEAVGRLAERYPFLTRVCRMTPHDNDLDELIAGAPVGPAPDRLYICYDDEQEALKAALTAEHLWPGGSGAVVVRLDRLASLREAFDGGDQVLDGLSGTLRLFGVVHAACDPALIGDDLVERLARVIHERYAVDVARRGAPARDNPALVPWHELPESLRQANRAQAGDIGRKLRAVGCALSPRVGPAPEHRLAETEIERLAVMEHERWLADRASTGWRYADERDDTRRLHPAMATWADLRDDMRTRNRDEARQLPVILADAGFRIVRQRSG